MTVELQRVTAQQIDQLRTELLAVYRAVFTLPPYNEAEPDFAAFAESFSRHVQHPDFRCYIAQDSATRSVCGFAYGFTIDAESRWYEFFYDLLQSKGREAWLADCFIMVELAVMPEYQGQGIGGRLHDALLADTPHRTAVLSTAQHENAALHLYRRRGWEILAQDWFFDQGEQPFYLLGLDLATRRADNR
ncbi:MAG TPA: GNAT family N-acetyltransferase [Herpetosiphonaceae bacterium]